MTFQNLRGIDINVQGVETRLYSLDEIITAFDLQNNKSYYRRKILTLTDGAWKRTDLEKQFQVECLSTCIESYKKFPYNKWLLSEAGVRELLRKCGVRVERDDEERTDDDDSNDNSHSPNIEFDEVQPCYNDDSDVAGDDIKKENSDSGSSGDYAENIDKKNNSDNDSDDGDFTFGGSERNNELLRAGYLRLAKYEDTPSENNDENKNLDLYYIYDAKTSQYLFHGIRIATFLKYSYPHGAIYYHVDPDCIIKLKDTVPVAFVDKNIRNWGNMELNLRNAQPNVLFLTQTGVHQLLLYSKKPQARRIQRWLCERVLPSIFSTGRYDVREDKSTEHEIVNVLKRKLQETESQLEAKRIAIEQKDATIVEKEAVIEQTCAIIELKNTIIERKDTIIEKKNTIIEEKDAAIERTARKLDAERRRNQLQKLAATRAEEYLIERHVPVLDDDLYEGGDGVRYSAAGEPDDDPSPDSLLGTKTTKRRKKKPPRKRNQILVVVLKDRNDPTWRAEDRVIEGLPLRVGVKKNPEDHRLYVIRAQRSYVKRALTNTRAKFPQMMVLGEWPYANPVIGLHFLADTGHGSKFRANHFDPCVDMKVDEMSEILKNAVKDAVRKDLVRIHSQTLISDYFSIGGGSDGGDAGGANRREGEAGGEQRQQAIVVGSCCAADE